MSENLLGKLGGLFRRETQQPRVEISKAVISLRGLACSLNEKTNTYEIDSGKVAKLSNDQRDVLVEDLGNSRHQKIKTLVGRFTPSMVTDSGAA